MAKKKTGEKAHAKYSPSAAYRWFNCPGSVSLSEKAPPSRSSSYADEGTEAHDCLETFLTAGPEKVLNTSAFLRKSHPTEMVLICEKAARDIWKLVPKGARLLCETEASVRHLHPEFWGTFDAAIIQPWGRLVVIDFKYGVGHIVEPEENHQMLTYALGMAHAEGFDFTEVELMVIQPRAEHEAGTTRSWVTNVERLLAFQEEARAAIKRTQAKDAPLVPDPNPPGWCRWCPASTICPAVSSRAFEQAQVDFADGVPTLPDKKEVFQMTPEVLGKVMDAIPKIKFWIGQVEEFAFDELKHGREVPGYKLVAKKGTRKWNDPKLALREAMKAFGPLALTTPELLSPAQLEKIKTPAMPAKKVKSWVEKRCETQSSGVTLAPLSDKRPASNQAELDFTSEI
jgi:hypothetical protein